MDPEIDPELGTPKNERGRVFWRPFGATWVILGAILDPAGFQGGSKNHVFGYHVGKMTKKGCPKTRPEKTSKID